MKRIKKYEEAVAAEFYGKGNDIWVEYGGLPPLSLRHFLTRAKNDVGANKILAALKKRMCDMRFSGDLIEFIKQYFLKYNDNYDVFIGNGTELGSAKPRFDKSELPH